MSSSTRHSAIFITAYIVTSLLNYTFGVALSWFFSPAQYGVLGVTQSMLLLMALAVGSGFSWTAAHDFASLGVTDDTRRRFRTAFLTNLLLGIFFAGLIWVAYQSRWLPLGPDYQPVIPLVGITVIILSGRAVVNGAARGIYYFSPVAVNLIGEVVVKVIVGLSFVVLGFSVAGVLGGFVAGAALSLAHSLWITRKARLWRGSGWFDRRVLRATAPLFIGVLGTALMLNLDILGLRLFSVPAQADQLAGIYQAAVILARTPVFIAQAITLVLFSYMAGATTDKGIGLTQNQSQNPDYLYSALKSWFHLLLPAGIALILAPRAALLVFFPSEYQSGAVALQIAALGAVVLALVTLLIGLLQAAGKRKVTSLVVGIAAMVQILSLILFVPRWGAYGAALTLLVAGLIAMIGLIPALKPQLNGSLAKLIREPLQIVRLCLPLIVLALTLILIGEQSRAMALVKFGLAGILYLLTLFSLRWQSAPGQRSPARYMLNHFVRVLLGG